MKTITRYIFFISLFYLSINEDGNAQFRIDTLADAPNIGFPVAMTFPPDGSNRLFFSEKNNGRIRIIRNDTLLPAAYLTVSVTGGGTEQGLLGLTFHPQYPDAPFFYIYYTRPGDRANQVVRYREIAGTPTNPETLMIIPRLTGATNHNGGNIHFGPDGKLYVSIGDYAVQANSQDTSNSNKRGKMHRLNYDGTIPPDNPFPGNTIYSYGSRNSFDFCFDTANGRMYASENGPSCNDEVNMIVAGGNFGWPNDGNCTYSGNPIYKRPIYYWPSALPAVTGIKVYHGNAFPQFEGKLLVVNYNLGSLLLFSLNAAGDSIVGGPTTLINFGTGLNDVETDAQGNIYLANGSYTGISRIYRLRPLITSPAAPTLISPNNGAINQPLNPTLVWHSSATATSYRLQESTDSFFSTTVIDDSTLTDTTMETYSHADSTTYFWRVRSSNSGGTSPWSETWQYTTHTEATLLLFVQDKWNLISVPLTVIDYDKSNLFPNATSNAFSYQLGYTAQTILANGIGYWLKFSDSQILPLNGTLRSNDSIAVQAGWNLIGSISFPVATSTITSEPGGMITSNFYGYESGYAAADTILPGKGYWVKVNQPGKLILASSSSLILKNRIRIIQSKELPPFLPQLRPFSRTPKN